MNHRLSTLAVLMILSAAFVSGCGQSKDPKYKSPPAGPEVTLKILNLDGIEQLKKSHRGKVVVVDYWSTSCEPCMKAFPGLVALARKYPEDVACISLSVDYEGIGKPEEKQDIVLKFLRDQKALLDNVLCSVESDEVLAKYKINSPPVIDVFDRDGKPAGRFDESSAGGKEDHDIYENVGKLVAKLVAK